MGLETERRDVTTEDGYILGLYRIFSKDIPVDTDKRPVLVQHGIYSDGVFFMIARNNSIVYRLVQAGYEVWIGNNRGVPYSNKHVTLDPNKDSIKFYDYSFYELGQYDLPALVDYILGQKRAR